ncbi:MAG: hypothetical protein HN352_15260 [Bacteroidetes bacterium]|jgi:hypothetical protein|nr:hypothetical protein [Bacteroidota bacterium]MBT3748412.1 hypothetical protein [Bacteroidota bacterium]MBT4398755.1 hypothetical protein [Bacteroidota bacterium]MBT5424642.1 hypothetical protein [Bacteroidota bacterium]MBT7464521.1 hypothetical protein [Bacteroidota bacterium]
MKIPGILLGLILVFLFGACETDPDIYIPGKPIPVIYAVFDDHETTHYILITKTFGAQKSPADFGFNHDSLYWDSLDIEVSLKEKFTNSWIHIKPEKVIGTNKDSGFFLYPGNEYYKFDRVIMDTPAHWEYPPVYSIDSITIRVSIPGYDDAFCSHKRIDSIRIVSPRYDQKYLFLAPNSPLLFNWDWFGNGPQQDPNIRPHAWNEIDVNFEIIEELEDGSRSKWITIQNTLYLKEHEKYRQMNITYEEFIRELLLQLEPDPKVIRRKLGIVKMHIAGGDEPMKNYMKFYFGHSDYNTLSYTNIQNAFGFFGTSTHYYKDSMRFDYETRQILVNENRLKKIKLSLWTNPQAEGK